MLKKWFAVGVALLLMSVLVAGCGIPQEEYDVVVAETDAAKAQIPSLENDLSEVRSEVDKAKSDLASVLSELAMAKSDLESAQSELASAESQASSAESQVSSLQSQIAPLTNDISVVQSDLKAAEKRIAELEAAIAAAEEAAAQAAATEEEEEAAEEIPPVLIGGIQLCSNITGGKCKLQPKATFDRGDTVYFYFQVFDPTYKVQSSGRYEVWLMIWGDLYGPDGNRLPESDIVGWYHKTDLEYPLLYVYSTLNYESKAGDEPGQYRFEFTVTDKISGAEGAGSATFTLSGEVAAEAEEEEEEEAEGLSFRATEYVNEEYGFSVKYPDSWEEITPKGEDTVFQVAGAPFDIPGMSIGILDIEEGVSFADVLAAIHEEDGDTDWEVKSEAASTTADGSPAIYIVGYYFSATGYDIDCAYLGAQKDGKWVIVMVYTVNEHAPFSKEKMSEVAHTLTFQ